MCIRDRDHIENPTYLNILKNALDESLGKLLAASGLMVLSGIGSTIESLSQLVKLFFGLLSAIGFILIAYIVVKHSRTNTALPQTSANALNQVPQTHSNNPTHVQQSTNEAPLISPAPLGNPNGCLLYTSPSPRDRTRSRMPSSA